MYVCGGIRTPFVKSLTLYRRITTQQLMTDCLRALVKQDGLEGQILGDVAIGAIMNSSADWNLARECVLGSGLHPCTPAYNVQRACGTSLETALQLSLKISAGQMEVGIAGGVDTNSDLPVMGTRELSWGLVDFQTAKTLTEKIKALTRINPKALLPQIPRVKEPRTGLSMGEHCEKMVQEWGIDRSSQDALALASHQTADRAYQEGFYKDLVIPYRGLNKDPLVRGDTSLEQLAKLKPAFDFTGKGTLTAGNSSPLTDGAAAVVLASEEGAKRLNLKPLARFVDAQVAALDYVHGDGLLMAPTRAVSDLLLRNQLELQDLDIYEIHEAFAGQVLCTLKAWESDAYCKKFLGREKALGSIDRSKMNIKGGSVALGHPFGATGGRIVASLAKMLSQNNKKSKGLISICTAGGMGVAALLESV